MNALSDKPTKSLKCGACGECGHMKTNKMCPKYSEASYHNSADSDDDLDTVEMSNISQDDLIKVDGTKVCVMNGLF